jgi:hypothetical protein
MPLMMSSLGRKGADAATTTMVSALLMRYEKGQKKKIEVMATLGWN